MNKATSITTPELRISYGPHVEGQAHRETRIQFAVIQEGPKGRESLELDVLIPPPLDGSIRQVQQTAIDRAIALLQSMREFG